MVLSDLKYVLLLPSNIADLRKDKLAVRLFNCTPENYKVGQTLAVKDSYFLPNEDAPLFAIITRVDICEDHKPSLRIWIKEIPHPLPYRAPIVSQKEVTGINTPENITKAINVVDAFTSNGVEKFEDIIKAILEKYGNIKPSFFKLLQIAYNNSIFINPKEGMTPIEEVTKYKREDFLPKK